MKAVIQRVIDACVTVEGVLKGRVDSGLLVYIGVALEDTEKDADWLAEKIVNMRIFNDNEGIMNFSIKDIVNPEKKLVNSKGLSASDMKIGILAVSQFTLLADARKGRRPSWSRAAPPEKAKNLYEYFIAKVREHGLVCECGEFQAHMKVMYTNDGPVTILLDSRDSLKTEQPSRELGSY